VFQVSDLSARDIMVPRAQMEIIDLSQPVAEWLPRILRNGHSRYPVIDGNRDSVIGILLAKDLLRWISDKSFDVRSMLRKPVFIPEYKRLNVLLRDFRANRNHIAIVVDEYGGVAGLLTIEDVLEQIVGDIEDEYDFDENAGNILPARPGQFGPRWRVKAQTGIEQFNEALGTTLPNDEVETIGGLVATGMGRVPTRGEVWESEGLRFEILRADARRIHVLLVDQPTRPAAPEDTH
jgi:magnesium and cobalt transporter